MGGTSLNCTFTVMEKNLGDRNMEFLLGLDMLKRYQCIMDLKAPARLILRAGGTETSGMVYPSCLPVSPASSSSTPSSSSSHFSLYSPFRSVGIHDTISNVVPVNDLKYIDIRSSQHDAVVVLADISGFTKLAERLARDNTGGEGHGTETLSRMLNSYFGRMIDMIYMGGGDVVKFAGLTLIRSSLSKVVPCVLLNVVFNGG